MRFVNLAEVVARFDGKRMKNGWKNSGAPWTYELDPELMYMPSKEAGAK